PTPERMLLFCESVEKIIDAGGKVFVYCGEGTGRTGAYLSAYYLYTKSTGLTARTAEHLVNQSVKVIGKACTKGHDPVKRELDENGGYSALKAF
ncbi:hypothetical protein GN156_26645, partial [bacterium LRH843]|nr:hypothetical protein [bacterium LRH843]